MLLLCWHAHLVDFKSFKTWLPFTLFKVYLVWHHKVRLYVYIYSRMYSHDIVRIATIYVLIEIEIKKLHLEVCKMPRISKS